jgi:cation:H+ antiporter
MDIVFVVAGLSLLLAAGDLLVRGAVALSLRMGIPTLIVGLTVVAFGTSAPELIISINAALSGVPDIAIGNVVGSNIANVLLVLGLPAVISTIHALGNGSQRSFVQMLAASVLLIVLAAVGPLHYWHAAVLLAVFGLILSDTVRVARATPDSVVEEVQELGSHVPGKRMWLYLVAGLIGLPLGAHLLIEGAVGISRSLGISEAVIGLTMVAVGTSLPELSTTVSAALRGQADVAIGNVIGSNLFNILLILGVTSLFGPLPVGPEFMSRDLWVMLGCSLLLVPFVMRGMPMGRIAGMVFLLLYAGYMYFLFHNGGPVA